MKINGWIIIDKQPNMTSMDVCRKLKFEYQQPCGHAGTLDPLATGILPIAFGKALSTIEFLHMNTKRYIFTVKFGILTDTYDITGKVLEENNIKNHDYIDTLNNFIGEITQIPPIFSAIKIKGVPAYKLARQNKEVEMVPRKVNVYSLKLLHYDDDTATFDVICSKGTYVRSLAVDIAKKSNMLGVILDIRRVEYGVFNEHHCKENNILPFDFALNFRKIHVDIKQAIKFSYGQQIFLPDTSINDINELFSIMYYNNTIGIGKVLNDVIIPVKIFTNKEEICQN